MSAARAPRRTALLSPVRIGVLLVVVTLLLFVVLFSKDRIATVLMAGDEVTVTFTDAYKLRPNVSEVKVGYVVVGKVAAVERTDDGEAEVRLKVDADVLDRLGSAPSATIRPTTLLGGSYFVDLQAGGDPGRFTSRSIPVERTSLPTELDAVARALQPDALEGVRSTVTDLDAALDEQGSAALERLLVDAPSALGPAAGVLDAAAGEQPDDLTRVVAGLESTARVLTENDGQLDSIVTGLTTTSTVLGQRGDEVGATLDGLPETLASTRATLDGLDGTLTTLRDMAADTRPVATNLDVALAALEPTVAEARPLVVDARTLVADARPLLEDLVPTASGLDAVLTDLEGPVVDRVNGPVVEFLHAQYEGSGPYSMTYSDRAMYEEIVFALANLARATSYADANGHSVGFQPGVGSGSIGGIPISIEQMFKALTSVLYLNDPVNTLPPLNGPGGGSGDLSDVLSRLLGFQP